MLNCQRAIAEAWSQVRRLGRLWLIPGVLLFIVLAGAWPWYIYKHVPNALNLWKIEYLNRYSGGLYLEVDANGRKRWALRLTVNGKRRDFGLGPCTV